LGQKKKRKTPKIKSEADRKDQLLAETRSADAATVAWTLSAMATLGALALRWLVKLIINSTNDPKDLPEATLFIPGLMLFAALISGIIAVSLTPLVYRLRKISPPWQVTAGIGVIGLVPLALLALSW
jgi:integral membrane sensor domain MASE1